MRRIISAFHFSTALFAMMVAIASTQAHGASVVARVAAVVNGEAILTTEIEKEMERIATLLQRSGGQALEQGELYDIVLRQMIEKKLQLQRIKELRLDVGQSQVDEAIESILARNGNITLESHLRNVGLGEDEFRSGVRDELLIDEAIFQDNRNEIGVDPEDVNHALRSRLARPELREYLLEHGHFDSSRRDLADQASSLLGEEFGEFAETYTISAEGVSLGWRTEEEMPTAFAAEIKNLSPGEVSRVLELGNGLHVIHLVSSRPLVPGHSQLATVKIKMLSGREGVTEQEMQAAFESLRAGQFDFDAAAESVGGEVWVLEDRLHDLPTSLIRKIRLRSGEIGGPFGYDGKLVIAQVLEMEDEVIGDVALRQQATALAADEIYLQVKRKWIEYLRSIGIVEIVRADP